MTRSIILFFTLISILPGCRQSEPKSLDNTGIESVQPVADSIAQGQSNEDRQIWQKPDEVIDMLGDLNGKVIADIGAGFGYFSFRLLSKAGRVIAVDIDPEMLRVLNGFKKSLRPALQENLDVRLATPDDPNLQPNEVDIILIVNTVAFISDRVQYFENLRKYLKSGGKIVIVDFKMKRIPLVSAPPYSDRVYLHIIEEQLDSSGYLQIETDDTSLDYQYLVFAQAP